MARKRRARKVAREVSRDEIVARARALAPWWLGSGVVIAALVAAVDWYERSVLGPLYPALRVAIALGIALGLGLAYLRTPDLGVNPGRPFGASRDPATPPSDAYQRALAAVGRSWLWAGGLFPLVCLILAEAAPVPRSAIDLPVAPLDAVGIILCAFLGGLAVLATFSTAWGVKLALIARSIGA
jgi:hypothetical protein